jgi:uncharacterized protein (DUF1800 family)
MLQPLNPAIAANRFGLGARPRELTVIGADGRDWLRAQLSTAPLLADAALRPSADILAQGLMLQRQIQAARRGRLANVTASDAATAAVVQKLPQYLKPIYVSEVTARLGVAVSSERPFTERLVQFWSNHFAVSVDKQYLAGLAGSFEREAIRPHVLGSFNDMLLGVETHPAMLLYLDNQQSVGPHSQVALRLQRRGGLRRIGINENLAREILELHTLGVGGGYTQADVTTFAQVITGWSIGGTGGRLAGGGDGKFEFRADLHEPGAKVVLGTRYPDAGFGQGVTVLRDLAHHRSTAHFIATKLARHFIADEPPAPAVERLTRVFMQTGGDLPSVYRALIDSREAWEQPLAKYKTPVDYIISGFRGLGLPVDAGRAPLAPFELLGQRTWQPGSPAGWPDRSADWDGASALMKRIEWADAVGQRLGNRRDAQQLAPELLGANLAETTRTAIAHAATASQAVTLLLSAPEFMRR